MRGGFGKHGREAHVPVLMEAVLACAQVRPGDVWVDCTLGFGGHALALLEAGARLFAIDQDPNALAAARHLIEESGFEATFLHGNFRDLANLLDAADVGPVNGLLADIGVSSYQLDDGQRGFSFRSAGPVDMRMDPTRGETAEALIRRSTVPELAHLIRENGEEPFAGPIARALHRWAEQGPGDTATLAAAVVDAIPAKAAAKRRHHPATRTFQALRIAVNDELGALDALLDTIPQVLAPGGRALIISFHSLEDRRVKRRFADWTGRNRPPAPRRGLPPPPAPPATFEDLTRKAAKATPEECAQNPRARSARLRAVRRLGAAA